MCRLPTDGEGNDGTEVAATAEEEEEALHGGGRDAWTVELPLPLGAAAAASARPQPAALQRFLAGLAMLPRHCPPSRAWIIGGAILLGF
eukprot:COSAG01_NODE_13887_length_1522_cov_1.434996_2_plen_89_part_00